MYGSMEIMKGDDQDSGGEYLLKNFEPTEDRRRQFARRRERESTKKRLKELQTERPVFDAVFNRAASSSSVNKRSKSRELLPNNAVITASAQEQGRMPQSAGTPAEDSDPMEQHHKRQHSFLYTMLSPHSNTLQAVIFKHFITFVIISDLIFFVMSTDQTFTYFSDRFYHAAEGMASSIFLLEYLARVYTVTEKKKYRDMGPISGRLAYMRSFSAIIDLVAALPFFLEIPTGWHLPTLTYLRFIRLFRILKTEDYVRALDAVYRVIYFNRQILYVACLVCIFLVLFTSVLLYYCRPRGDQANPLFDSLGDTIYMSTLMLTGGGGPDTENLPWYTKAVVLLTSVFSVAMFAIPASMLTWGFEAEAERMAKQARKRALKRREMEKSTGTSSFYTCSSSSDDESDGNTTDEEYFKLIAGIDEEEEEDETPWMKEQRRKFEAADVDMDGTLTIKEYMKLQQDNMDSPLEPQQFLKRLNALEIQVADNSVKLTRILELLEKQHQS